jgi:uncharacterized metal-binding protein
MPNGDVHAAAGGELLMVIGVTTVVSAALAPPELTIIAASSFIGAFGGWLVTPDIDLYQLNTYEEQRILRWFGWLGYLWIGYWWITYARWHGHHGHGSHYFLVGSIPRFLLLWWPLIPVTWGLSNWPPDLIQCIWLGILLGHVVCQDGLHLLMDLIWKQRDPYHRHHHH